MATALSAAEVTTAALDLQAPPTVGVVLAEAIGFDLQARQLHIAPVLDEPEPPPRRYDALDVAAARSTPLSADLPAVFGRCSRLA